jgi:hypothetical protein
VRVSTTTGRPSASLNRSAKIRASESTPPPGGKPEMMRVWASAGATQSGINASSGSKTKRNGFMEI